MKTSSKFLAMILAAALLISCISGAYAAGTTLFPCDEDGYPDLGGVTLTIWCKMESSYADFIDSNSDMTVVKNLAEKLNVNLEFIQPAVGGEKEGFSTMLNSGNYPDIIIDGYVASNYPGGLTMAYEDGFLVDITDKVTAETAPHFWALVMENDFYAKLAKDDTGRLIGFGKRVSGCDEMTAPYTAMVIRKDYLAQTGLDVPVTIDDWTEMLRAFKAIGVKYPLLLNTSGHYKNNMFSGAWNIDAKNFYLTEDGSIAYGPTSAEYKEYVKTLALWYSEGLINPDFGTDTQDDNWTMLANGDGAACVSHSFKYGACFYEVVEKDNPEMGCVAAQIPKLSEDDDLTHVLARSGGLGGGMNITASCQNVDAAIAFIDALYIDEVNYSMQYGIEGLGYTLDENGYPVLTNAEYNSEATEEEKRGVRLTMLGTHEDYDADYIMTAKYCYGAQPEALKLYSQCSYDRYINKDWLSFTAEESEILSDVKTDVETYRDEMFMKFVTGVVDIDAEYDNYVQTITAMGLDQMQEVYEAAYARYLTR